MKTSLHRQFFHALLVVGCSCIVQGCDESLPPRIKPERFLKASLFVRPNSIVNVFIDSAVAGFPITINGASGSINVSLKNFYNEVLEARPSINAKVDVWLTSEPTIHTSVLFGEADVEYPYIEPGGLLTVLPGDSVSMTKQWHHIADVGRAFWNYVQLRGRVDGTGRFYYESAPVRYTATATVQAFENVPAERTGPYEFELVYHVYVRFPP